MRERALKVWRRLDVHHQGVGAGLRKSVDVAIGIDDHEVDVHGELRGGAHHLHDARPERQVRDELPIHHVHVNQVGARRFCRAHFVGQPPEVGAQNRGGNAHRVRHVSLSLTRPRGERARSAEPR